MTKMTLDEARAVIWPFKELKGKSIGSLVDSKVIDLRDLGYAVEHAYNRRVAEAARVVLLDALQAQAIVPTPGSLNVVISERRSFSERQQALYFLLQGTVVGIVLGVGLALFFVRFIFVFNRQQVSSPEIHSNALIVLLALGIFLLLNLAFFGLFYYSLNWIISQLDRQIKLHRKGQRGEERIMSMLYQHLDSNWWVFRNLEFPGRRSGDIDFVLVSPQGMWIIEAKTLDGEYRNIGEHWERRLGSRWMPALTNPSRQAKRGAATLAQFLQSHDVKQWVQPVVIWANPDSVLTVEKPSVYVWNILQVADELQKLDSARALPSEQIARIVEILRALVI